MEPMLKRHNARYNCYGLFNPIFNGGGVEKKRQRQRWRTFFSVSANESTIYESFTGRCSPVHFGMLVAASHSSLFFSSNRPAIFSPHCSQRKQPRILEEDREQAVSVIDDSNIGRGGSSYGKRGEKADLSQGKANFASNYILLPYFSFFFLFRTLD